jgi:hypothetical protein
MAIELVSGSGVGASGSGVASLTTGNAAVSGSDLFVVGVAGSTNQNPTDFKFGGSGGTSVDPAVAAQAVFFDLAKMRAFAEVAAPGNPTTYYADFAGNGVCSILGAVLSGVDQSTPHDTPQVSPANEYSSASGTIPISFNVTGDDGQTVIALLDVMDAGDRNVSLAAGDDTEILASFVPSYGSASQLHLLAVLRAVISGSSVTLNVDLTPVGSTGFVGWRFVALPMNEAAGGPAFLAAWARGSNQVIVSGD